MICYHGSLNTVGRVEDDVYRHRHALVSFAYPDSIDAVKTLSSSYVLDNGAFTAWRHGGCIDLAAYAEWVKGHASSNFDWAIIPDVIDGTSDENDALLDAWPLPHEVSAPVWHLDEHLSRLTMLCGKYRTVCIGSSGKLSNPGTPAWFKRMQQVFEVTCRFPFAKIHGLRMMNPTIWTRLPFASVDSSNLARNQHAFPGGIHKMLRVLESAVPARTSPSFDLGLFDEV
jgi:hypothetical protein